MSKEDKYLILRDRQSWFSPLYLMTKAQTDSGSRKLYGKLPQNVRVIFKKGRVRSVMVRKDWNSVGTHIGKNLYGNKDYFKKIKKLIQKEDFKMEVFLKNLNKVNFSILSFSEIIILINETVDAFIEYEKVNVPVWFMGADVFREKLIKRLNLSESDFSILSLPKEKTMASQSELGFLEISVRVESDNAKIEETAQGFSEKYGWLPHGYDGPEYWDENYFIKKINQEIENGIDLVSAKIEKIKKADAERVILYKKTVENSNLTKEDLRLFDILKELAIFTDDRKKWDFQLFHHFSRALKELEKRYGIPYKNLKFLLIEELPDLENNKIELLKKSNYRINNEIIADKNGVLSNEKTKEFMAEIKSQQKISSKIKGMVASKGKENDGKYRGAVKILLTPQEGGKIKKGDFLVTTMTTPDYIISMGKAVGFITDEGGVTCHAAIIAREMNKPCIIGTKNATQVLKDGDIVEVDANKGTVKVLEKNKK